MTDLATHRAAKHAAVLAALPGTTAAIAFSTGMARRNVQKYIIQLEALELVHIARTIQPKRKAHSGGAQEFYWTRGKSPLPMREEAKAARDRKEAEVARRRASHFTLSARSAHRNLAAAMGAWR